MLSDFVVIHMHVGFSPVQTGGRTRGLPQARDERGEPSAGLGNAGTPQIPGSKRMQ